jgi:hypothetical protein
MSKKREIVIKALNFKVFFRRYINSFFQRGGFERHGCWASYKPFYIEEPER